MKKINDSRIYGFSALAFFTVAVFFCGISLYSRLSVEPRVEKLIASPEGVSMNYKKAYLHLREPQLFGGYEFFDADGFTVRNSIQHFDKKIYGGGDLSVEDKRYLDVLLDRRKKGSMLGLKTSAFFILLSLAGFSLYFFERRVVGK